MKNEKNKSKKKSNAYTRGSRASVQKLNYSYLGSLETDFFFTQTHTHYFGFLQLQTFFRYFGIVFQQTAWFHRILHFFEDICNFQLIQIDNMVSYYLKFSAGIW